MRAPRGALSLDCADEAATHAAAAALSERLRPGDLLSLEGDLGAGKTVFVRGLAESCGIDPEAVTSPSFVLAIDHPQGRPPLLHVDLYRLPSEGGIDDLGIEEALEDGYLVAVEWGERLPDLLRESAWRIIVTIPQTDTATARTILVLPPPQSSR